MKKFARVSLITAGIMGALGCLLCLISVLGGGRNVITYAREPYILERLEEKGGLTRRLLRLAGLGAGNGSDPGAGSVALSGSLRLNGRGTGTNNAEDQIDITDVRKLSLALGAGTFTVKEKEAGDGESIDLYIQGVGDCDYYVEDSTLFVNGFKGNHFVSRNANSITLKFPMGMSFEEVEIEMGAGIMDCYDLRARELEATVGAGALSMYRSRADELSVELGAGELYASQMEAQEAKLTVGLGNCAWEGEISRSLEAECDMGSAVFILKGKETDFNYEIECNGGTIEMGGYGGSGIGMEKRIDNGAGRDMELTCNLGNITVNFEE